MSKRSLKKKSQPKIEEFENEFEESVHEDKIIEHNKSFQVENEQEVIEELENTPLQNLQNQLNDKLIKIENTTNEITQVLQRQVKKKQEFINKLDQVKQDFEDINQQQHLQIQKAVDESLQSTIANGNIYLEKIRAATEENTQVIDELEKEINQTQIEIDKNRKQFQYLERDYKRCQRENVTLSHELSQVKQQQFNLQDVQNLKNQEVSDLQREVDEMSDAIEKLKHVRGILNKVIGIKGTTEILGSRTEARNSESSKIQNKQRKNSEQKPRQSDSQFGDNSDNFWYQQDEPLGNQPLKLPKVDQKQY